MEELVGKFKKWKDGIECRGLKVIIKAKVMVSSCDSAPAVSAGI